MTKSIPAIDSLGWGERLNDHLGQLMNPIKGGFNIWTNSTRPWSNNDSSKDAMDNYTGLNEDTGKFEIWNASTRSWKINTDVQISASYSGSGTVYGLYSTTDNKQYCKGINSKFTSELSTGDYIVVKNRAIRIIKVIDNNTAESEPVLKDIAEPVNQAVTFTEDSNVLTVENSSLLTVGDLLYKPASYYFRIVGIINSTTILLNRESWFSSTVTDLLTNKILSQAEADTFVIKKSIISLADETGKNIFSTSPFGRTFSKALFTSTDWEDTDLDSVGSSAIRVNSIYDLDSSRYRTTSLSANIAVKTNETAGYVGLSSTTNSRSYDPLDVDSFQGTLGYLRGFAVYCGHHISGSKPTNDTAVTNRLHTLFVRTANWFGSIGTAVGIQIDSQLGFNGADKVANYFPIYESGGGNLGNDGTKVRNYFRSRTGFNTSAPSEQVHVVGNILATGTVTQSSDERLKKDITTVDGALAKISQIKGVTYTWKNPENHGDDEGRQLGVIAQDVEKVFPEAVKEDKEGIKSVNYGDMVAPLIEAVKELKLIIDQQQKEIEELRSVISNHA